MADAAIASKTAGGATAKFTDGSALEASAPMWWDSSQGGDVTGPAGNAVPELVAQGTDSSSVALDVSTAISRRKVTYPVYVDQAYPTQSYLNGAYATGQQRVGYVDAVHSPDSRNHLARSSFKLDTNGVESKSILAAQLSTSEDCAFSCTKSWVGLYWTSDVTPDATWNTTPPNA